MTLATRPWGASCAGSARRSLAQPEASRSSVRAPSIEGAWGVAIDGDDNVWLASFLGEKVTQLCGRTASNCPPGAKTGDPISPSLSGFTNGGLQHITAVQVDQSGNVWAAIGAAPLVKTPMIGPPQQPNGSRR
jgi:hypothetical protein